MAISIDALSGLTLFCQVVHHGSLTGAATALGLSRSAVSKQLARFEANLGAKLLNRTTRQLALTELGERVWLEAQQIQQSLENVEAITDDYREQVRGRLKVSCSSALGRVQLLPLLPGFAERYPDIELILQLEDRISDMVAEQVDVAIRAGHLPDSSLVARKLGEFVWQMAASPAYLAKRGMPKTPAELARHDCLYYRNGKVATNRWHFSGPGLPQQIKVSGPLAINDAGVLVDAACAGMGIVMVNESLLAQPLADGRLQAVLPEYEPAPGFPVYAVYPAREWLPAKTVAFVDYLIEHLSP